MAPFEQKSISTKKQGNEKLSDAACAHEDVCNENALYSRLSQENFEKMFIIDFSCRELSCLESLPPDVESLNLRKNRLSALPDNFKNLKKLRYLNLSENRFEKLCISFSQGFESLEYLDLSRNRLNNLIIRRKAHLQFPSLSDISENLVSLNLSENKLSNLPDNFKYLNKLKYLNLSGNFFTKLPNCFALGMESLERLDLSRNILKDFTAPRTTSFKSLEYIDLKENKLTSIPEWLLSWNCSPLKELNLSSNPCLDNIIGTSFYEKFHLVHLMKRSISRTVKELCIRNCELTIKNSILFLAFDSVEKLNVSNAYGSQQPNYLPSIPTAAMERMKLTYLNVSRVSLQNLNNSIAKFTNLRILIANNNCLTWIPDSFCGLTSLEYCDLSNNEIVELPNNIEKLLRLRVLLLAFNRLRYVHDFQKLGLLQELDLYMNELSEPPEINGTNFIGVDLERNFFDTKQIDLKIVNYSKLRNAFRKKYRLTRNLGNNFYSRSNSNFSRSNSNFPSSCSSSSSSCSVEECGSDIWNDSVVVPSFEPEECWDDEGGYYSSDEFDPNVHSLQVSPGGFVWRYRLWSGSLWKPLQVRMFGKMRCQNPLDNVIRADIPETQSNCFMKNSWIKEDYAEYMPFVIHPHCIVYEDEVRKLREIPPVEGQFDDADE